MESRALDDAVLFAGRGGSGTRLLSELAARAGIFIGNRVNKSGDSIEWVDLIYRMVVEAGGGHDLPVGSHYREAIRARARRILEAPPPRASPLWGLKLPESMLVLPLLVDAFPRAKVVHLIRHPITSSLRRTHLTSRLNNAVGAVALPAAYGYCRRDVARIATDEPYLHNACSWNFQVTRVARYGREVLGRERYLEIAYEDVCAEPARMFALVRSYLGCVDEPDVAMPIDLLRAGSWDPRDQRIEVIWEVCGETAALLGYRRA
ncbi:MAG TPA: sulfotransferase [Casimicrobiaceae bacterium]|nr:sulfotransferase [Casimicrobiaceae bacterium]